MPPRAPRDLARALREHRARQPLPACHSRDRPRRAPYPLGAPAGRHKAGTFPITHRSRTAHCWLRECWQRRRDDVAPLASCIARRNVFRASPFGRSCGLRGSGYRKREDLQHHSDLRFPSHGRCLSQATLRILHGSQLSRLQGRPPPERPLLQDFGRAQMTRTPRTGGATAATFPFGARTKLNAGATPTGHTDVLGRGRRRPATAQEDAMLECSSPTRARSASPTQNLPAVRPKGLTWRAAPRLQCSTGSV